MSALLRVYNIADHLEAWGWSAVVVPKQLSLVQRRRVLRLFRPDLILFQTSRHPLNDPDLYPGQRIVYDIDDADFFDDQVVDRIRRTCSQAVGVIAGSQFVADWCRQHNDKVQVIWTGTPCSDMTRLPQTERAPIVTWAQSNPTGYKAEFRFVCDLMLEVRKQYDKPFSLRLYGWKEDDDTTLIDGLKAQSVEIERLPFLRYPEFMASLTQAAVGLCPLDQQSDFSKGKSFGKILGYLDAMVPIIASDMGEHAQFFTAQTGVVSNDPSVWVEAIIKLLDDASARQIMAERAFEAFKAELTDVAAARKVDAFLTSLLRPH